MDRGSAERLPATPGLHRRRYLLRAAGRTAAAQGNPFVAGLIALGVGWLVGSLLPATRAERQAADTLKEKAAPLAHEVSEMAKESAQNLQEPAKQAVEEVRSTGTEAVETVKAEGASTASDVTDSAKGSAQTVKQSTQNS